MAAILLLRESSKRWNSAEAEAVRTIEAHGVLTSGQIFTYMSAGLYYYLDARYCVMPETSPSLGVIELKGGERELFSASATPTAGTSASEATEPPGAHLFSGSAHASQDLPLPHALIHNRGGLRILSVIQNELLD
jgi:hypothetical protein